jgi:hypothetical protein
VAITEWTQQWPPQKASFVLAKVRFFRSAGVEEI